MRPAYATRRNARTRTIETFKLLRARISSADRLGLKERKVLRVSQTLLLATKDLPQLLFLSVPDLEKSFFLLMLLIALWQIGCQENKLHSQANKSESSQHCAPSHRPLRHRIGAKFCRECDYTNRNLETCNLRKTFKSLPNCGAW